MPSVDQEDARLIDTIRARAHPLLAAANDYSPLLNAIGDRSIVLLGAATHGTREFYRSRFEITRRLIEEKGFCAIALEADWPDCQRINRYIHRHTTDETAEEALGAFQKFPMWIWRNQETVEMIEWLRTHNRANRSQVSVFGIDLYNLYSSIREVIAYLDKVDPDSADRARKLYSCFDHMDKTPARYGRHVRIGTKASCENEVVQVLEDLFERRLQESAMNASDAEDLFFAQQNAENARSAEIYFRNLFNPLVNTWNIRDRHMSDTVECILRFLEKQGCSQKLVIWAHNSHVGDCRATELSQGGQWNLGQLLRMRFPQQTYHVGYTTYEGRVQAAGRWDHPPKLHMVRPAVPGSYEKLFHETELTNFILETLGAGDEAKDDIGDVEKLERAIGVIYSTDTERISHYFHARIAHQFDAVIHFDLTTGVMPLDRVPRPEVAPPSEIQL